MNLITNWQLNGNCRPWYWEKIAYKATLERRGFKFTHPFRHWGEHWNHRIFCLACLVQMNDILVFYLKTRDSLKFLHLRCKTLAIFLCILLNISNIVAFSIHDIPNELKSFHYYALYSLLPPCIRGTAPWRGKHIRLINNNKMPSVITLIFLSVLWEFMHCIFRVTICDTWKLKPTVG